MDANDIENRFTYHPPATSEQVERHELVREMCGHLAHSLNTLLPDGREKSLAITHLEEVMMWGNAALARDPRNIK
jgi:hypothetical protein